MYILLYWSLNLRWINFLASLQVDSIPSASMSRSVYIAHWHSWLLNKPSFFKLFTLNDFSTEMSPIQFALGGQIQYY
jgi:hypothetical protein